MTRQARPIARAVAMSCALAMTAPQALAADWPSLDTPPPPVAQPASADAALLVGIEDYAFAPDVPGALQNLEAWYLHLRKHRGLPIDHITLLRDGEATREAIEAGLSAAMGKVGSGGTIWVVFVGHGAPAPDRQDGLLVGADARATPRSLGERGLGRRALLGQLEDGPQDRAVVVLDACFSGLDRAGGPLVSGLQPLVPLKTAAPGERTVVFTAAGDTQFAGPLPGVERPAFSYLLLGAMRGWADRDRDGRVTVDEAHGYTTRALAALVTDRSQTPGRYGAAPDPVIGRAFESGPDLDAMRLARPAPTPPEPVVAPAPRRPLGARVRIETQEDDFEFTAYLATPNGARHACPAPVSADRPCDLDGVAPGTAVVRLAGDLQTRSDFGVPMGATVVRVHDLPTWPYWVGGALMVAGMASFGIGFGARSSCDDEPSCSDTTEGLYTGLAIGGFFVGNGVGGGLIAWAAYKGLQTGFDEVEVESFPDTRAGFRLNVTPTQGGAMIGLGWR